MVRFKHRHWWYTPAELARWATLKGCRNFERHPTWRVA